MVDEQVDIRRNDGTFMGTDIVAVWENAEFLLRPKFNSFLDYLKFSYPDYDWTMDDGFDWDENSGTDYCQYVAYLNEKKSHCLLASYRYQ